MTTSAQSQSPSQDEGVRALAELTPRLSAMQDAAVVRPSTDPHGAAATALLVADYLAQAELQGQLESAAMSAAAVHELRSLARAIITVVTGLGGDYLPDSPSIPGDLVQRGQSIRTTIAGALEKALPDDTNLQMWLEAIRLGSGVVDLVYDLRTLAALCAHYGNSAPAASATVGAAQMAVSAADAVEFALRTGDPPESAQARNTLARLWTLFVPAYDRAAAAARKLSRGGGSERQFPELALVASHRRARRRPLSLSHAPPRRTVSPRRSGLPSAVPASMTAARASASIPASPRLPDFDDVELIEAYDVEADDAEAVEIDRSEPPATPHTASSEEREGWSDTRIASRHTFEIEVGIASDSNFYLGFTENLSAGGVFVATYVTKPLGSQVAVALAFPNGEELRVPGVVRWHREGTADAWPGMGVQFESLSPEDEAKVRKFLSLREPMFYDE